MKYLLYLAIVISVVIALYEVYFWDTGLSIILAVISVILAFYGYVLLKCCCTTTKRKR